MPKPPPFQRRRVALAGVPTPRDWKYVRAALLQPGDTVAEKGTVELVDFESLRAESDGQVVTVRFRSGNEKAYHVQLPVWAFAAADTCSAIFPVEYDRKDGGATTRTCVAARGHDGMHQSVRKWF